jgi:diphthine-ammonia ligase
MIESGLHAVLVKVAALGLDPYKHLGRSLAQLQPLLLRLSDQFGLHVCGEGGEYETMTLDCAMFTAARIVLDESEVRCG